MDQRTMHLVSRIEGPNTILDRMSPSAPLHRVVSFDGGLTAQCAGLTQCCLQGIVALAQGLLQAARDHVLLAFPHPCKVSMGLLETVTAI